MDYWTLKKKAIMGSMQSGKVTEAEGYPLKLENAIKGNMKDYKIWGNKKGKNLCPLSTYTATGTGVNNNIQNIYPRSTKAVQHTFSMRVISMDNVVSESNVLSIVFYFKDGSYLVKNISISQVELNGVTSITIQTLSEIPRIRITTPATLQSGTIIVDNIQLEEGTEATEYEPYQENDGLGAFGNIDVVNSGKNLLKATDVYKGASNYQELVEDGRNCIRFIDNVTYKYYYSFKENAQYTVSFDCKTVKISDGNTSGSGVFHFFYDDNSSSHIYVAQNENWKCSTLTSDANKTVVAIGLTSYNWVNWCYIDIDTFQLEEGIATPYEPYIEPITTTIDLTGHNSIMPNEYIDFKNQVIVRSDGTEEDIILPKIPLHKGYNIITASDAELEATKMYGKYLKKG